MKMEVKKGNTFLCLTALALRIIPLGGGNFYLILSDFCL